MNLVSKKGVTLVELLAVIVIMGIIAAIAVPSVFSVINNSKKDGALETANNLKNASLNYFVINNTDDSVTVQELLDGDYLEADNAWTANKDVVVTYDGKAITAIDDLVIDSFTIVYENGNFTI